MLKRVINYKNFNDEDRTRTEYFHLSRTELIELEAGFDSGLTAHLQALIETDDVGKIMQLFKNLILMSYGVKSEDGDRFIKNEQVKNDFENSAAFDAMFMELITTPDTQIEFIKGIIPAELAEHMDQDKPLVPPTPPKPAAFPS